MKNLKETSFRFSKKYWKVPLYFIAFADFEALDEIDQTI